MICQPTATRKGKRPNGPGRPRIHLTRGTLACRSAGADAATPIPGDRRQPPHTATVRGGCPQGAIAAEGLQMAMSVRPCPGCSAVPAGIADAGLREQYRAEMVKCIRLCLDRTDICTATLGVVNPPDGVRRGRHQAAAGGLRSHLQELRRRAREALPATRIRPLGTCPASSMPTRRMRWITRAVLQPTSAAGALPGPLWCGSAEAHRSGQSARCHPALAAQLTCTRNRRSARIRRPQGRSNQSRSVMAAMEPASGRNSVSVHGPHGPQRR